MSTKRTPLALIILDGWGYRAEQEGNAIALAQTPYYDEIVERYSQTLLEASGVCVGLPTGVIGNSEVGHLNMGAGRVIYTDIRRIDHAIESDEFFQNEVLVAAMENPKRRDRALHFMGLLSDGKVHSSQDHLYALLRMAHDRGVERVFVHCFMDGRDTMPHNGVGYLEALQEKIREIGCGRIASVIGRYYAMDRDKRWERTQLAYDLLVHGMGERTLIRSKQSVVHTSEKPPTSFSNRSPSPMPRARPWPPSGTATR